jgi:acetyltransferase-like isoleucine patch superfamily enzyme
MPEDACEVKWLNTPRITYLGTAVIESFLLRIKRAESPFYRMLRRLAQGLMRSRLPVPRVFFPLFRFLYHLHFGVIYGARWCLNFFYREPLFRSRCVSIGEGFHMWLMPDISGHPHITIGNHVNFFGHISIMSGRMFDSPSLVIGDRVDIGHNVAFVVNKEIVIEDDVKIASGVRFMDTDAHPRDTAARMANLAPPLDEIRPVRISKNAWIGQNSFILKGVTIGEEAVIGVNSVVVTDIPAYTVAMGNPARVVIRNRPPAVDNESTVGSSTA